MFTKKTLPWTVIPFVSHDHLGGLLQEIHIIIAENSGIFHPPPQKKNTGYVNQLSVAPTKAKMAKWLFSKCEKKNTHPTCCSDFEHVDVGEISEIGIRCKLKFLPKIKSPQHSCSPPRHWFFRKQKHPNGCRLGIRLWVDHPFNKGIIIQVSKTSSSARSTSKLNQSMTCGAACCFKILGNVWQCTCPQFQRCSLLFLIF